MPIFKNLPVRLKGGGPVLDNALFFRRMSLNINPHHNPFEHDDDNIHGNGGHESHWSPGSSLLDGDMPRDRNPFEDEEDENEANEGKKGNGSGGSVKGSFKFKSPLKSLGKLGKNLRMSGKSKDGDTPSPQGSLQGTPSPSQKKKRGRRSSEGSLLRWDTAYPSVDFTGQETTETRDIWLRSSSDGNIYVSSIHRSIDFSLVLLTKGTLIKLGSRFEIFCLFIIKRYKQEG